MKKFAYFYDKTPISKLKFLMAVPEFWEDDLKDGTYSYGYYRANEIEE